MVIDTVEVNTRGSNGGIKGLGGSEICGKRRRVIASGSKSGVNGRSVSDVYGKSYGYEKWL